MIRILNRALWIFFLVLTPLTFIGILSQNSIPGDFLYSTKRSYEGAALAFASLVPETKASYTTSLATTRFTEAEKLLLVKSDTQGLATLVEQVQAAQDNVAAVQQNSSQKVQLEQKLIASIDTYQESLGKVQEQIAASVPSQTITTGQTPSVQQVQTAPIQTTQTNPPAGPSPIQTSGQNPTPTQIQPSQTPTRTAASPTNTAVQTSVPTTQAPIQTSIPTQTPIPTQPPNATTPDQQKKIDEEIKKTRDKLAKIREKIKNQTNQAVPAEAKPQPTQSAPTVPPSTTAPGVPANQINGSTTNTGEKTNDTNRK